MVIMCSSIDKWRNYFESADGDIFEVIKQAVVVAALDHPKEFKLERDGIAEKLFSCLMTRCHHSCDHEGLSILSGKQVESEERVKSNLVESGVCGGSDVRSGGKVITSSTNDNLTGNHVSNFSYDEAEALTEEIEEENQMVGEVLRIKEILLNRENESPKELYDSLRRLQLMALSVSTLKVTEIGKAVNNLRKHKSKDISDLSRTLVNDWRSLVDDWVSATKAIRAAATDGSPDSVNPMHPSLKAAATDGSPDSVNPTAVDEEEEEGLPSPPLDEAFFATQPTSMELSKFFDGMDEDGNLHNREEFDKSRVSGNRRTSQNPYRRPQHPVQNASLLKKENNSHMVPRQETVVKQTKPGNTDSAARRLAYSSFDHNKVSHETPLQPKKDTVGTRSLLSFDKHDKLQSSDEVSVRLKLEAAKRRLHEGYQQAENAKKQRTIQVMDFRDMPKKPSSGNKNSHVRPGHHNRSFGRR
ncbi:hypothetical protein GIB67_023159 [Kingdonia uniflora]|uniref:TFIIS N-terminal domain-containing protein n=1 Tax=Kingdonia uniflora TaxID=39325 RepID=A0A7J7M604_9MAGN|nr:hypothetical protein GIB67_023159 [Kingdonia uniflora]